MINGFFYTFQQDLIDVAEAFQAKAPRNQTQNERVSMAALRIFASGIMGTGILKTISAFSFFATAPVSAVLTAAVGVGLYALGHDVFLLTRRHQNSQNPLSNLENDTKGLFRDLVNLFTGNEAGNGRLKEFTKDTFFQPMWIQLFSKA